MSSPLHLLTTAELAAHLKRAPETLVRWRRLRQGPPFRLINGRVLYEMADVVSWLNAATNDASTCQPGALS